MTKPTKAEVLNAVKDAILACQKVSKMLQEGSPAHGLAIDVILTLCLITSLVEHDSAGSIA